MRDNSRTKEQAHATSFASATKIVVAVNRLTGLRPLHYSDTKFWIFLNYSYRMIMVIAVGYVMYSIYMYKLLKIHVKKDRLVYLSMRIANYLCFVWVQALGWYYSNEIPGLRRRIAVLEESLAKLGAVANNRNIFLWIIGTYIATILHVLMVFIVLGNWVLPTPTTIGLHRAFFSYIANIGTQVLLDFITYECWLKCSFKQTNDLLKTFLVESRRINTGDIGNETNEDISDRRNVHKYLNKCMTEHSLRRIRVAPLNKIPGVKHKLQGGKKVHMLQEIRCIHLQLCRVMETINNTFDSQIMVYSLVFVANFVIILYNVYAELRKYYEDPLGLSATSVPVWDILFTCAKISITCYVCESTVKEMKKVIQIIHESSISDFDVELKDEIFQFSLQLSLIQVCDRKIDALRLSFSFLRQCASSITTYLIILIQWAQSIRPDYQLGLNVTQSFQAQFNQTI